MQILAMLALVIPMHGSSRAEAFEGMEWLTKRCWKGTFPGTQITDQHCFGWDYGNKFIHDYHVVKTPGKADYRGETVYAYDEGEGHIVYWYWSSEGSYSTGTMEVVDGELIAPEEHTRDDGTKVIMRNRWTRDGEDAYIARAERKTDDGWVVMFEVRYEDVRRLQTDVAPIDVPDGESWALAYSSYRTGDYDVFRQDLGAEHEQNLTADPASDWVWAGGADLLLVSNRRGAGYEVYRTEPGGAMHLIDEPSVNGSSLGRSADRDYMVVSRGRHEEAELYLLDGNGKTLRQLTDNDCADMDPDLSPDGSTVVYRSFCGGAWDLWLMAVDSGTTRRLTANPDNDDEQGYGGEGPGRFSPDGKKIAWMSWNDGHWDIWTYDLANDDATRITEDQGDDAFPAWSPDGRYLAFHTDRDGDDEIYVMDADGSNPRRMTFSPGYDHAPVWLVSR